MSAADNTARAQAKFVRVTPQKARRVIDLIRGMDALEAQTLLRFAPQSASEPIGKVLGSAIANATNNYNLDARTLVVKEAFVDEGPTMKRFEEIVLNAEPAATFKVLKTEEGWEVVANGTQRYTWLFDPKTRVIESTNEAARKIGRTISVKDAIFEPSNKPEPVVAEAPQASVHDLVEELRSRRQAQTEIKPQTAKGRASLPSWDEIVLGTSHLESDSN